MSDEELIRAHWEAVHVCDGSYKGHPRGTVLLMIANHKHLPFPSFADAAEYGRGHLEEIRQVEEEIAAVSDLIAMYVENRKPMWLRILARERQVLGDLKRGIKQ